MTYPRCYWTTTPHLLMQEPSVARRQGPGSVYLLRKYTLNGLVIEATTASCPYTKVGVKFIAASRLPYDHPTAHNLTYSSRRWRLCSVVNWAHDGGTVGATPLTNRPCPWTATPNLPAQEPPVARHQGPESIYLRRKYALDGRATEGATASGPDTKVGANVSRSSYTPAVRPPYGPDTSRTAADGGGCARL